VITNSEVKAELDKENIACENREDGQETTVGSFQLSAHGKDHAMIHQLCQFAQNTGYLINGKIFHPGDSLVVPPVSIDFLLLPVVAPWSKISETLDFIDGVKTKKKFFQFMTVS